MSRSLKSNDGLSESFRLEILEYEKILQRCAEYLNITLEEAKNRYENRYSPETEGIDEIVSLFRSFQMIERKKVFEPISKFMDKSGLSLGEAMRMVDLYHNFKLSEEEEKVFEELTDNFYTKVHNEFRNNTTEEERIEIAKSSMGCLYDVQSKYVNVLQNDKISQELEKTKLLDQNIDELERAKLIAQYTDIEPELSTNFRRKKCLFVLKVLLKWNPSELITEANEMNIEHLEECMKCFMR